MTSFPRNPFKPGAGTLPAHMGRRPETEHVLSQVVEDLSSGDRNSYAVFVYGPRGNGKTVLLRWLREKADAANVATVALVPEHLSSPAGLIEAVRTATERFPKFGEWVSKVEAELGGVRIGFSSRDSMPHLENFLNRGGDGLLLTLDEAHEAPSDMLGRFLNAVQLAGERRPVAVVFAGTPGLETSMRAARASFWSRGRTLRIGLLEDASAQEALARPFRDAGIATDDGAIADLAFAADNYPYFLQLYGETAWDAVKASGGRTFLPEHVAPAFKAANGSRRDYYRDRYEEFREAKLLPLARRVAEAFVASARAAPADRRLTDAAFEDLLTCESSHDHRIFLIAKGYVWQDSPETELWTPGIPSLMDGLHARTYSGRVMLVADVSTTLFLRASAALRVHRGKVLLWPPPARCRLSARRVTPPSVMASGAADGGFDSGRANACFENGSGFGLGLEGWC